MSSPQEIEKDLREYLEKEQNLRRGDRLQHLMAVFQKHLAFSKLDHMVTSSDLFNIISDAKMAYSNKSKTHLTGRKIDQSEFTPICMVEAFILYANRNNLLKKSVNFDYTDSTSNFDSIED